MGCGTNFGIRRLIDSNQRYFNASSGPLYYRTQNFQSANTNYGEMGFTLVPSLSGGSEGTTDTQICPPPAVKSMTLRMLESAQASGSALRAGAVEITLSATWVNSMQTKMGYDDPKQVFNDRSVIGLVQGKLLYQIVSYNDSPVYGASLDWILLCNANEIK